MGPAGTFRPPTVAPSDDHTRTSCRPTPRTAGGPVSGRWSRSMVPSAVRSVIGLTVAVLALVAFTAQDAALIGRGDPAAAEVPAGLPAEDTDEDTDGDTVEDETVTGEPGDADGGGPAAAESDGAGIAGSVRQSTGDPAKGLVVELFTTGPDLQPDRRLTDVATGDDGGYRFDELAADCYVVRFEAPDGASFGEAASRFEALSCVDPGQRDESVDAELSAGPAGRPFELTILHIGDHHSHLRPDQLTVELDGESTEIEIGGLARVATKIAERAEAVGGGNTLAVHSGGALSGTLLYPVFGGAADAAAMNTICFDVAGVGRQDIALGDDVIRGFADFLADGDCDTEMVTAEEVAFEHRRLTGSTVVRRVDGGVIGFVAVPDAGPDTSVAAVTGPGSTLDRDTLDNLATTVQASIDELARRGVANVVLVSNVGLDNDLALVPRLTGVDAVVGGGSDSLLGDFSTLGLDVDGRYPQRVDNLDGQPVCIGHAWRNARVVGELTLSFDGRGGSGSCDGEAHLLVATVEPDPITAATIDGYIEALGELSREAVGTVTEELCFTRTPSRTVGVLCGDDVIGDATRRPADVQLLIAEAIRARTGAEVGVVDAGVTGNGLAPGPLRVEDAQGLAGGDHQIVHLTMTGAEMAAVLEDAVELAIDDRSSADSYPHVAGLQWTYDPAAPPGARIVELRVREAGGDAVDVEPSGSLVVATVGYLADAGVEANGYRVFAAVVADGRATRTYVDFSQALFDYIRDDLAGVVTPNEPGPSAKDPAIDPTADPNPDEGEEPSQRGANR